MIMRSAKVPLSPSSALQTMYFCGALASAATVRHLMPVGNPAPPRPRRPDCTTSSTIASAPSGKRAFEALAAAVGAIVVERARIDDAAAREGQPRLPLEPGDVLGRAEPQRVRAVGEDGVEQALGIARRDRAIGDAACRRFHLDHRLEPIEAARAGAHDLDRDLAPRRRGADRGRDLFGADRQRPGVGRNEQPQRHCCASASSASSRRLIEPRDHPAVQHGRRRQRAKAEAIDRLERDAAVGGGFAHRHAQARLGASASGSPPAAWQASARQSLSTCRPAGSRRKS